MWKLKCCKNWYYKGTYTKVCVFVHGLNLLEGPWIWTDDSIGSHYKELNAKSRTQRKTVNCSDSLFVVHVWHSFLLQYHTVEFHQFWVQYGSCIHIFTDLSTSISSIPALPHILCSYCELLGFEHFSTSFEYWQKSSHNLNVTRIFTGMFDHRIIIYTSSLSSIYFQPHK